MIIIITIAVIVIFNYLFKLILLSILPLLSFLDTENNICQSQIELLVFSNNAIDKYTENIPTLLTLTVFRVGEPKRPSTYFSPVTSTM